MKHPMQRMASFVAATAFLGLYVLSVVFYTDPALAAIRQLEEASGQVVYQSRQALQDQYGDRWQVIAFNRIRPDGGASFYLRLVGFPGAAAIDRSRPLTLTTSLGQSLSAADASSQIFTDASTPEPNVGQYDMQPIAAQLPVAVPMQLALPLQGKNDSLLSISPALIQEWKTVAAYE